MSDSGRGSGSWKFMLPLFLLLAIEVGIASFLVFCCWFVAKKMSGSMVGAVC